MNTLLQSPWMERLGWALLHSLWQGAALWMFLSMVLVAGRRASARQRHCLACLALALLALCPVLTTAWLARPAVAVIHAHEIAQVSISVSPPPAHLLPARGLEAALQTSAPSGTPHDSQLPWTQQALRFLVLAWLAGVILLTLRLLSGFVWLKPLRRSGTPLDSTWSGILRDLCRRFSLPIPLVRSVHRLGIPLVAGWLRPVIYLPASMLSGLSAAEVESVLLHEMAHLKRRDPLWHLGITTVETLLFYHPATHALSRIARESAEEACDDMVLGWTQDRKTYARALAALEESRGERLVLAASGSPLRNRLRRILGQGGDSASSGVSLRFGVAGVGSVAAFLALSSLGVPQLARALTAQERTAAVEKKRAEVTTKTVPAEKKVQLVAIGQIHLPEGAASPKVYRLGTFPPRYNNQRKGHELSDVRVELSTDKTTVAVWAEDFAPAESQVSPVDPGTHQASFDLMLQRGHPAIFKIVDEQGKPIAGAQVHVAATWKSGVLLDRIGDHLVTDAEGRVAAGRAVADSRFAVDVIAHGFEWRLFSDIGCAADHPAVLQVKRARPIAVEVVDINTGKAVAGCRAICTNHQRTRGNWYTEYPAYGEMPAMAAVPSDAAGHLVLDVCDPEEVLGVEFFAQGYQHPHVRVTAETRDFRVELKPAITLSGVIHDPDHFLNREDREPVLMVSYPTMTIGLDCPDRPDGIPFKLDYLPPGEISVRVDDHVWSANLKENLVGLELQTTPHGLVSLHAPGLKSDKRRVEIHFDLPPGSLPLEGEVNVSTRNGNPRVKVVGGRADLDVPVPGGLQVSPGGLNGWTFNDHSVEVEEGNEPLVLRIPCMPAGAITGRIDVSKVGPDPVPDFLGGIRSTSVIVISDEGVNMAGSDLKTHNFDSRNVQELQNPRRYFASALPLPGRYRIFAHHESYFTESPVMLLDESHPVLEQNLVFREGVTISGTVLLPDGTPFDGAETQLVYVEPTYVINVGLRKSAGGHFELHGVNFAMKGHYLLCVSAARGTTPLVEELKDSSRNMTLKVERGLPLDVELVDANDHPVSGLQVCSGSAGGMGAAHELYHAGVINADGPSDVKGRVHFSSFLPGSFKIYLNGASDWELVNDKPATLDPVVVELPRSNSPPVRLRVQKR